MKHIYRTCRIVFALLMGVVLINGCASGPQDPITDTPNVKHIRKIETTIFGRILDESHTPMQDVAVTCEGISVRTDELGYFLFRNITVPENRCFVIAKKNGYFNASRADVPVKDDVTRMQLGMQSTLMTKPLNATTGGTVTITNGAEITFAPGSLRKKDGSLYMGTARIIARYLSPDDTDFFNFFSGDYTGNTSTGDEVQLISCGVIRTLLRSSSDEELTLDPAKPATLSYPVPKLQTGAPVSMPLWYFDEKIGMWKEDGTAALTGGKYVGTVTHFTDFNLDYMSERGELTFKVICDDQPALNVTVQIRGILSITSPDGIFNIRNVPAGIPLQIDILAADNNGLYYLNTPVSFTVPVNGSLDLGTIVLSSPCPAQFFTSVKDCNDKPIDAMLRIVVQDEEYARYSKTGSFMIAAESSKMIRLTAVTTDGYSVNTIVEPLASYEKRDIGPLKVCGDRTADFYDITASVNGYKALNFSPDAKYLIAANALTKTLTIYETESGRKITTIAIPTDSVQTYLRIQMSSDNTRLLLTGRSNNVGTLIYKFDGVSLTLLSSRKDVVLSKLYDNGSRYIGLVSGGSRSISIFQADNGSHITLLHSTDGTVNYANVVGLLLDNETNTLAVCDLYENIKLFDAASDRFIAALPISSRFYDITANAVGSLFGYTNTGASISVIVDMRTGTADIFEGKPFMEPNAALLALGTMRALFASPSNKNLILTVYHLQTRQKTDELILPAYDVLQTSDAALSRDEKRLAVIGKDKIRVWRLK